MSQFFHSTEKVENLATTLELPLSARSVVLKSIFSFYLCQLKVEG